MSKSALPGFVWGPMSASRKPCGGRPPRKRPSVAAWDAIASGSLLPAVYFADARVGDDVRCGADASAGRGDVNHILVGHQSVFVMASDPTKTPTKGPTKKPTSAGHSVANTTVPGVVPTARDVGHARPRAMVSL